MSGNPAITKKIISTSVGIFSLKILGVVLGVAVSWVLTKQLSVEEFGKYTLILSLFQVFFPVFCFGLPDVLVRGTSVAHSNNDERKKMGMFHLAKKGTLISSIAVCLLIIAFDFLSVDYMEGLPLLVLMPCLFYLRSLMLGFRMVVTSQLGETIFLPITFLFFILVFISGFDCSLTAEEIVLLRVAAVLVSVIGALILLVRAHGLKSQRCPGEPVDLTRSMAYFVSIGLLDMLIKNAEVLALGAMVGNEPVAIFRIAFLIVSLVAFVPFAFNSLVGPEIAKSFSERDFEKVNHLNTLGARLSVGVIMLLVIGIYLIGGHILELVFGSAYKESYDLVLIMCGGLVLAELLGSVCLTLNMTGNENLSVYGLIVGVIVSLVMNVMLIPAYGLYGCAIANVVSLLVCRIVLWILLYKKTGIRSGILA